MPSNDLLSQPPMSELYEKEVYHRLNDEKVTRIERHVDYMTLLILIL